MDNQRTASKSPWVSAVWALLSLGLAMAVTLASQAVKPGQASGQAAASEVSVEEGRHAFENRCAGCHGLDARGGEHAPDIAKNARTQARSDEQLTRIIFKGLPGTGMPAFGSMTDGDVANVIAYLRALQGKGAPAKMPGDAKNGRFVFYGKAKCAECHMVAGSGGFLAGDLTVYAGTRGVDEIRSAITKPAAPGRLGARMTVTTRDSGQFTGVVRNEDNFSIQLQGLDGSYHLFTKTEVGKLEREPGSLMPSNYGSTLSAAEVNDLISFLMRAAHEAKADEAKKKGPDEYEEEE